MVREQKKTANNQQLLSQPGRKKNIINPDFGLETQNKLTITGGGVPGVRTIQVGLDVKNDFQIVPGLEKLLDVPTGIVVDWGNGQKSSDKVKDPSGKTKIRQNPAGKKYKIPQQAPPGSRAPQHLASLGSNGIVNQCDPLKFA